MNTKRIAKFILYKVVEVMATAAAVYGAFKGLVALGKFGNSVTGMWQCFDTAGELFMSGLFYAWLLFLVGMLSIACGYGVSAWIKWNWKKAGE